MEAGSPMLPLAARPQFDAALAKMVRFSDSRVAVYDAGVDRSTVRCAETRTLGPKR